MCGIVGYLGTQNAKEIILEGLYKLEYRGYDSAGMSLYNEKKHRFFNYKDKGRVEHLKALLDDVEDSHIGIGHTRWATHGKVNQLNAHPHVSSSERFLVVHNGVIENYKDLQRAYLKDGRLKSETDTEVIVELIEMFSHNFSAEDSVLKTLSLLKGSYALLVIDQDDPNRIIAAKNKSPLLVGKGKDGFVIASDLMAMAKYADDYKALDDYTMVVINHNAVFYNLDGKTLDVTFDPMDFDEDLTELGEYQHYMLKEIMEQPLVMRKIMSHYLEDAAININQTILDDITAADHIYIIAAGTSMHAGFIGKSYLETLTDKPASVHIASEFAYHPPRFTKNPFFILISQSGETADLRACLVHIKTRNYNVLTITNVRTSTLAREANYYLEIYAGPEIAVASTKAYTAQLAVLMILAYSLSEKPFNLKKELSHLAIQMEAFLENYAHIYKLTQDYLTKRNAFYIGRGNDYYVALEAALKLKEISYIQAEGFAAGELKHGTIALIEEGTPVFALISDKKIAGNTRSNLYEVESRGANTLTITCESLKEDGDHIVLPDVTPLLMPLLMVLPTQLIAYYAALDRGLDIDKPRNLAKSVTVE
ncbi:MAG: glutamine--fructose-6-phosphate transaminase (isomerizing) [Bacillota bacterium]